MDLYDIICQWLNILDNCPSSYRFPHQTKLHWTNFPPTKFSVGHNYCHQAIISALLSDKKHFQQIFVWRSEQTIDHFNVFKIHTVEGLVTYLCTVIKLRTPGIDIHYRKPSKVPKVRANNHGADTKCHNQWIQLSINKPINTSIKPINQSFLEYVRKKSFWLKLFIRWLACKKFLVRHIFLLSCYHQQKIKGNQNKLLRCKQLRWSFVSKFSIQWLHIRVLNTLPWIEHEAYLKKLH